MAPRATMFVTIDGESHVLAGDEHTPCFLVVPHGSIWTTDQPDDLCAECADKTGLTTKAKAKSGRKA